MAVPSRAGRDTLNIKVQAPPLQRLAARAVSDQGARARAVARLPLVPHDGPAVLGPRDAISQHHPAAAPVDLALLVPVPRVVDRVQLAWLGLGLGLGLGFGLGVGLGFGSGSLVVDRV